jgi:hypothetical protein
MDNVQKHNIWTLTIVQKTSNSEGTGTALNSDVRK